MRRFFLIGLLTLSIFGLGLEKVLQASVQAAPKTSASPPKSLTDADFLGQPKPASPQQEMVKAVAAWENDMRLKDPEFDQKLQFVWDREWGLCGGKPAPTTPREGLAMVQQAYAEVTERLNWFVAFRSGFGRRRINIFSDPPGARIEISGNYIGITPCSFDVNCNGDGTFTTPTKIVATPVDSGWFFNRLYPQRKEFNGRVNHSNCLYNDTPQTAPTPVPETVFFSLKQQPS